MIFVARYLLCCLLVGIVGGCTRPVTDVPSAGYSDLQGEIRQEMGDVLEKFVDAQRRLYQVAGPILLVNADLCPRRASSLGFVVFSDFDVPHDVRYVAYERLLLNGDAKVLGVIPQSQAWLNGVRSGDTLLTLNGHRVRNAADARARFRKIKEDAPAKVGFIRDGRSFTVTIAPQPICNYRLIYLHGDRDINAYATGSEIHVSQGMMDFANDEELAIIVGHELAHNVMHHMRKKVDNNRIIRTVGTMIDGVTGVLLLGTPVETLMGLYETKYWSPKFEKEADYVGMYLVARAKGNMDPAAPLWRRMAAEHAGEGVVYHAGDINTHPAHPERFIVLKMTQAEIMEKARLGQPIMPNLRESWVYGEKYSRWDQDDTEDDLIFEDLNH